MKLTKRYIVLIFALFYCAEASAQSLLPRIRLKISGTKYNSGAGELRVNISVDTTLPTVLTGNQADQMFRDDNVSAAFFGYYLTLGTITRNQLFLSAHNIKVRRGAGETTGRSFYLLGNGATTPSSQTMLTQAPPGYTTFVSLPVNGRYCGNNWVANNTGNGLCGEAALVPNLDITQFVKVMYSDDPADLIRSQLDFIAVVE